MEPNEPVPVRDYTGDEHWGIGGRYVIDPLTGRRVPAAPAPVTPNPSEPSPEGAEHDH